MMTTEKVNGVVVDVTECERLRLAATTEEPDAYGRFERWRQEHGYQWCIAGGDYYIPAPQRLIDLAARDVFTGPKHTAGTSQLIGDFLDFADEVGMRLCEHSASNYNEVRALLIAEHRRHAYELWAVEHDPRYRPEGWYPVSYGGIQGLLATLYGIDLAQVDREKRALLAAIIRGESE